MLTPAFHFTILNDFMTVFNSETTVIKSQNLTTFFQILIEQLALARKSDTTIDLYQFVKRFALDVICSMWFTIFSKNPFQ
jgi:hypothetical protein